MRRWYLIPLGIVLLVLIGLPVAAFTNTGLEQDLREDLGIETGECEPMTDLASAWTTGADLPYELDEPRGTALDGAVYLVGGITGLEHGPHERLLLEPSDEVTRFDPKTETFTALAPLPQKLNHIGVVAYKHDLYVLGGYGHTLDTGTRASFYRYDPDTDRWSRMPEMPEPRAAMAVGVVGDRLIVAGGARDNVPRSQAFAFDFGTGRWERLPDMLSRREHVGATTVGDRLYVLGGRAPASLAIDTAESYDVSERRWRRLPPMLTGSGGLGVVEVGGEVIAVGGGNDGAGTVTGAVQEWDPRAERWSYISPMRTPRHGHATVALDHRIWVFGGSPCAYFNATDSVEELDLGRDAPG
jgi:N-acetylneuraminic acid mutarotase